MGLNGRTLREGDYLTLDGSEGVIHPGRARVVTPLPHALLDWREPLHRRIAV